MSRVVCDPITVVSKAQSTGQMQGQHEMWLTEGKKIIIVNYYKISIALMLSGCGPQQSDGRSRSVIRQISTRRPSMDACGPPYN